MRDAIPKPVRARSCRRRQERASARKAALIREGRAAFPVFREAAVLRLPACMLGKGKKGAGGMDGKIWIKKGKAVSFKQKLTLVCTLAIVIPVVFSFCLVRQQERQQRERVYQEAHARLKEITRELEQNTALLGQIVNVILQDYDFIRYLGRDFTMTAENVLYHTNTAYPMLQTVEYTYPQLIDSLSVYCTNPSIPESGHLIRQLSAIAGRPYYREFLQGEEPAAIFWDGLGHPTNPDSGNGTYKYIQKLYRLDGSMQGVAVLSVPVEKMFPMVLNSRTEDPVAVVQQGEVVCSIHYDPQAGEDWEGPLWISTGLQMIPATVYTRVSRESLQAVARIKAALYTSCLLGLLAMAAAIYLLMHILFSRLHRIVETMGCACRGNFHLRLENIGPMDEIGRIAADCNQLLEQMEAAVQRALQQEAEKKDMQLLSLQYQINPHFICNALHTIQLSVEEKGEMEVADAISYFVRILRYNISGTMETTLEKELEHGRNYIRYTNVWRQAPIQLEIETDPELAGAAMIKFVVQPILENAVHHGRASRQGAARIWIIARRRGEWVDMEFRNESQEGQWEKIAQVNRQLREEEGRFLAAKSGGIGLKNIRDRLKLQYGERADLFLSTQGGITVTHISFPFEPSA